MLGRPVGGRRALHEWGARRAGCSRRSGGKPESRPGVGGRKRSRGEGGKGKSARGRGGAARERRAESGEAAGVSESGGRRVGRFGAAVRCAASALAVRHRLRDPEELPAPRTGQRSRD